MGKSKKLNLTTKMKILKLLTLLLLALPAVVQVQFTFRINNRTITITK